MEILVSIIIFLCFNLEISVSSVKIIQKPVQQVDFKNTDMLNQEKIFVFKNYLSTMMMASESSLTNSIWSKMSYYHGKSIEEFRNEELDFSVSGAHPNLMRFVKINDRNLRCHFQNNNITIVHAMKHFKNILKRETDEEKTTFLCVINAKEKIKLDEENDNMILETNDCLFISPKLMAAMSEKNYNEKDKIEV